MFKLAIFGWKRNQHLFSLALIGILLFSPVATRAQQTLPHANHPIQDNSIEVPIPIYLFAFQNGDIVGIAPIDQNLAVGCVSHLGNSTEAENSSKTLTDPECALVDLSLGVPSIISEDDVGVVHASMGARYYQAKRGQFLSQDNVFRTLGDEYGLKAYGANQNTLLMNPQSLNSYSYALNNPILHTDPDGNIIPALMALPALVTFLSSVSFIIPAMMDNPKQTASLLPGTGDYMAARDAWTGTDSVTGASMSGGERVLAGFSAIPLFGSIGDVGRGILKDISVLHFGKEIYKGTVDLTPTLGRIESGGKFPHPRDGTVFRNEDSQLPAKENGYYTEYVHPTEGIRGPGPQRVVTGKSGEVYYTPDHYDSFIKINEK